ncbi:glycerophosphodiester phosphodiesterase [Flagellimonas olearia]|uniref:Glycerophosphodiester phosphodiesterase n=1 Tax=Flagellimonas olearia TaxID=552546 RepID=A0A6I1DXT8_9FLAO|nr:glycerophosphodiester phosphodiesterase [Allomuricauda olearia]
MNFSVICSQLARRGVFLILPLLFSNLSCSEKMDTSARVIAHRGAWKTQELPENSIAALKHAIELGCYGAEFDVHMTMDSIPVVNHDPDFMGMDIERTNYADLLSASLPNGEKIPTLEAYLKEGLRQDRTRLILEIKKAPSGKEHTLLLTEKAVALVKQLGGEDLVEYITFDFDAGVRVSQLAPGSEVAYLNGDMTPSEVKKSGYTSIDYNIKVYRKHPEWIEEAHRENMTVNVWTVNTEEDMADMIQKKVDFITTNEPERLFALLSSQK